MKVLRLLFSSREIIKKNFISALTCLVALLAFAVQWSNASTLYTGRNSQAAIFSYDVSTGTPLSNFGTSYPLSAMAFGDDGYLYTGYAGTNRIFSYDVSTGGMVSNFGTSYPLSAMAFGDDGYLYTGYTGTNRIFSYDVSTGGMVSNFGTSVPVTAMAFAPAVVPEPVSSALFIAGGATLGFGRFKKKFKT